MVVDPAYSHERKRTAHTAERPHAGGGVEVGLGHIEMVRLGRVHPPSVHAEVVQAGEVFPVYVACLGAVWIVDTYTRRVVHARRPHVVDARFRPCGDVEQEPFAVKLAVLLGLRPA